MKKQLLIIVGSLFFGWSFAQQGDGGLPKGEKLSNGFKEIDTRVFAQPDIEALRLEDEVNDIEKTGPWRFGFNNYTSLNLSNSGSWYDIPAGRVWLLKLKCQEALTVNLTFDNTEIPEGNELYVYNPQKDFILGKFTAYHLYEGQLGTELVPGNTVIVEYFVSSYNYDANRVGSVQVGTVTHGYRTADEYLEKAFGGSGSCNMNVNCPDGAAWTNQRNSAVMLVSGSSGFCSGALINNTLNDGKPYVLTANHCYSNPATWVFRFNWQATACTNPGSSPTFQSLSGAVLRSRRTPSDFCLVEITGGLVSGTVPAAYNPYFSGWDNSGVIPSSTVCVHHPSGDIKKISFDDAAPAISQGMGSTEANSTWTVEWDRNTTTEGGSSGSPLFDQNHRIIGQLWGGGASCSNLSAPDYYGRVSSSWNPSGSNSTNHLVTWLDPNTTGAQFIDGYDPSGASAAAIDAGVAGLTLSEVIICGTDFEPTMNLSNSGTTTLTSAIIEYSIDGGAIQTYNWIGSLAQWQSQVVTLPTVSLTVGAHTMSVNVVSPNGSTDENLANNNATTNITVNAIPETMVTLTVNFLTDDYPEETYMEITNSLGNVVWSEGNENVDGNFGTGNANPTADPTNALTANNSYSWNVTLPALDCYTFSIYDYYGDGVDSQQWGGTNGSLSILSNSGATLYTLNPVDFGGDESTTVRNVEGGSGAGLGEFNATVIKLYPNPSNGQFLIDANGMIITSVKVMNVSGQEIMSKRIGASEANIQLDLSAGIYLVEVLTENGSTNKRMVIK